jgi:hypothetical protein
VVYATIERSGSKLEVHVVRLRASDGTTLQEEQMTGYETAAEDLFRKLADLFVQRFTLDEGR